jgi:hypothetical protein
VRLQPEIVIHRDHLFVLLDVQGFPSLWNFKVTVIFNTLIALLVSRNHSTLAEQLWF